RRRGAGQVEQARQSRRGHRRRRGQAGRRRIQEQALPQGARLLREGRRGAGAAEEEGARGGQGRRPVQRHEAGGRVRRRRQGEEPVRPLLVRVDVLVRQGGRDEGRGGRRLREEA